MLQFRFALSPFGSFQPTPLPLPPVMPQQVFNGTAGNNSFTGTSDADTFNMQDGGRDRIVAGAGDDTINFGAALTAADRIDAGADSDTVNLAGNYSGANALVFGANTMVGTETLTLSGGKFNLTMNDSSVAAGQVFLIDASALTGGQSLTFDGSLETDGEYKILAGPGAASLTGSARGDEFDFGDGFKVTNRIDGGGDETDFDLLVLDGDYSSGLVFQPDTIHSVIGIAFVAGHNYDITIDAANVAPGLHFFVLGPDLGSGDSLVFDGSAVSELSTLGIQGGSGDDHLIAGAGNDLLFAGFSGDGGRDVLEGRDGNDEISVFAGLGPHDRIDGGDGKDVVRLRGNYDDLAFRSTTVRNVEVLLLDATFHYGLRLHSGTVAAGDTLTIDGRALGEFDVMSVDASLSGGFLKFLGGGADDIFTLGLSGEDIVKAGANDDAIFALGNMTAACRIDGELGFDSLVLDGDYSLGLTFQDNTLKSIGEVIFMPGHGYAVTLADGNIGAFEVLAIHGDALLADDLLIVNASAETDGRIIADGGAGDDAIIGGAKSDVIRTHDGGDVIDISAGGDDTVSCGIGNDTVTAGAAFTSGDDIVGDDGTDTLILNGDYTAVTALPAFEIVQLAPGHDYTLTANVAGGFAMSIQATTLGAADGLTFQGSGTGSYTVNCGAGNDSVVGGAGIDTLIGNGGADSLKGNLGADNLAGGAGNDTFSYTIVAHSTSINYDKIMGANFSGDLFNFVDAVTGVDAMVTTGTLSDISQVKFDGDLHNALGGHLLANHAILFNPDSGSLALREFLIVDANGTAGYQASEDFVIDVTGFIGTLGTGDFI